MKRIGLTGGVGSGKSTVAKLFQGWGIPMVDADQIARKLREPGGKAEASIVKRFGTTDRVKLREILVRDERAKKDLEAILHPLIQQESNATLMQLEMANPQAPFILYEAALLVEADRLGDFQGLIYVSSPDEIRVKRIMERDHCTEEQAKSLIRAQLGDEVKFALATKAARLTQAAHQANSSPIEVIRIENNGSLDDLKKKAQKILDHLK